MNTTIRFIALLLPFYLQASLNSALPNIAPHLSRAQLYDTIQQKNRRIDELQRENARLLQQQKQKIYPNELRKAFNQPKINGRPLECFPPVTLGSKRSSAWSPRE